MFYLHKYSHGFSNFNDTVIQIFQKMLVMTVSVATVATDIFQLNWFSMRNKIGKISKIFVKIEDSENRGVI